VEKMTRCAPPLPCRKCAGDSDSDSPVRVVRLCRLRPSVRSCRQFRTGAVLAIVHAQQHGVARRVLVEAGAQAAQDQLHCHTGCWLNSINRLVSITGTGCATILSFINAPRCELQAREALDDSKSPTPAPAQTSASTAPWHMNKNPHPYLTLVAVTQHSVTGCHTRGNCEPRQGRTFRNQLLATLPYA